ncbi:MAG: hypothetical protein PHD31_02680 [Candidatus Pacebacteria bacterium]|nr:hypothetical protein [Candidatus Paceibacterota bacterium]
MKSIICSSCGEKITRDDLQYSESGYMAYSFTIDKNGEPTFGENEDFESDECESGKFYHDRCGETLDSEELLKLGIKF